MYLFIIIIVIILFFNFICDLLMLLTMVGLSVLFLRLIFFWQKIVMEINTLEEELYFRYVNNLNRVVVGPKLTDDLESLSLRREVGSP